MLELCSSAGSFAAMQHHAGALLQRRQQSCHGRQRVRPLFDYGSGFLVFWFSGFSWVLRTLKYSSFFASVFLPTIISY
jgi:hypothetical protein